MEREKRTCSGALLEVDFYPVFSDGRKIPTRAPKTKPSSEQQQKYNRKTAIRKYIRYANANFDTSDYLMHPTYQPAKAPQDEKEARRDIVNYIRRVKTKRKSELKALQKSLSEAEAASEASPGNQFILDSIGKLKAAIKKLKKPFRYMYVIERQTYKTGIYAGRVNWHFHMFMTGGIEARTLEQMWSGTMRSNCNNYQPDRFGPEAAARYMTKDPQGSKSFVLSKNIIHPQETVKDGTVSRRTVEKMAAQRCDDAKYWENRYKGYRFLKCFARYNEFNGHWYVSALMYRTTSDPPPIKVDDWFTDVA